ncbi:ABC transporter ATP-binding protein [Ornithinibacillus halophilus]|uniref:ABC-2 type transport system ATP-binding protein n=1 Tax=Ornithinibacillus halophilus TaxID=930117 RepID=A0A1M5J247_9BACI|nr:ABC transporter ATP-binding protein [Ornithinibacillus halophilus]SHG34435.1 ABC-2 type transport system ATP-binding protein [Ornithinibacillus halophilus]
MLKVQRIHKKYGKTTVLNNLSFSIAPGEIIGLVGENGAGKSTLLKLLATIEKPTSGKLSYKELTYDKKRKEVRKRIGYVPQDVAIWDDLTVKENMKFFEKLSWVNKSEDELFQLCKDMNLDRWKDPVKNLSGGMKRKLNLAISLIHDPEILLLDEPTVGIDLKSRKEIGAYLQTLKEQQKMIVYISHDMDEITELCDRVICIGSDPFYKNVLEESGKKMIICK